MEKLAIVVPCYNEEEVLKIASEALRGVLDDLIHKGKIAEDSFILFVNDGSKDRTWELIEEEHQAHPVQVCGVLFQVTRTEYLPGFNPRSISQFASRIQIQDNIIVIN